MNKSAEYYTDSDLKAELNEISNMATRWWTGGEPMEHWEDIKRFVDYEKCISNVMVSAIPKFIPDMRKSISRLIIDVKLKSANIKYNQVPIISQFIDEDKLPIELKMVVDNTLDQIQEAQAIIDEFYFLPITLQPLYWDENKYKQEERLDDGSFHHMSTQPEGGSIEDWYTTMLDAFKDHHPNVRLLPQLHKMIWPGQQRGI